ncbi:MAG TPA: hypothetical protein VEX69_08875 [Candidatus Limnocylindria bacterium]|nr:hypothetical protein [Candidatus Limnocylindria bacterium]
MNTANNFSSQSFERTSHAESLSQHRARRSGFRWASAAALLAMCALLSACFGGAAAFLPFIASISPNSIPGSGQAVAATISGTGFASAIVEINGQSVTVTSVTSTQIGFIVPGSLLTTPGTLTVIVVNLLPSGNVTSNSSTITVIPSGPAPAWTITKMHTATFQQGGTGSYTITVKNSGTASTDGTMVTVSDAMPTGLTVGTATGTGWNCSTTPTSITCTQTTVLTAGSSYQPITLTVAIATNAPATITNTVSISGGGAPGATGSDTVTVTGAPVPAWTITKMHTGTFQQGGTGSYTISVKNSGTASTNGTVVTVSDTMPTGLTVGTATGTGWNCSTTPTSITCTQTTVLTAGSSYQPITLTVVIATNAPATITNTVSISGGGAPPATASDTVVVNSGGGGAVINITGLGPGSVGVFIDANDVFTLKNTGSSNLMGATVVFTPSTDLFTASNISSPDPWNCTLATLTCTRSDALAPGASYDPIVITYQVANGAGVSLTIHAAASGGGAANAATDLVTPLLTCSAGGSNLCGQYALLVQGYTSAGPKAIAASFTADGNSHITAGILDMNSMGAPVVGTQILTTAPTAYNFENNGYGNIIFNTSAGVFVFKFQLNILGNVGTVIEFEPNGTSSGSGVLLQQSSAFTAASVSGGYAYSLVGGPGGASSGVREGMIGAINANGTCGFSASGATGTVNNGGTVSTAVNFSGALNPASCSVDPVTGRGTGMFTSITGSPAPTFSTVHFAYYLIGVNSNDYATSMIVISTDQASATQPILGGRAIRQVSAPFSTNAAIDCGVAGNPTGSTGCIFGSSGASGGNSLTGNAHVGVGRVTVTTQSNTAGNMSLLLDDNKGGVINSGTVAATYSYAADGTGTVTPASGEGTAFVLTGTDAGLTLGTGGSVSTGFFSAQKATTLSTPQLYLPGTHWEGTINVTNSIAVLSATPSSPGSNSGTLLGFIRFWDSATHQNAGMLTGTYTTDPLTGRGTGTTVTIPGAATMGYYVLDSTSIVLLGLTPGDASPVLATFQIP